MSTSRSKPITVLVTGTGTANKGAELLLVAIKEELARSIPTGRITVPPDFGSFEDRARYGLRTVLPSSKIGRWWLAGKMMPRAFRRSCGVVAEKDIDAVLDASGFAFGDQLGAARVTQFAKDVQRWRRLRIPVVLMPQAFGPFKDPAVRSAFIDAARHADLIFAREAVSLNHLTELGIESTKLRQSPDFTNLVHPSAVGATESTHKALIVPNHQMVAKTSDSESKAYIPFLARCYRQSSELGLNPAVLLHDDRIDRELIQPLQEELGTTFPVLSEPDPVRLKGHLGSARLVIGSRFHALVGSLSQAVPTIAVGWSHKYQMLLADYDCPDAVLTVEADEDKIAALINQVLTEWDARHEAARRASDEMKVRSQKMWLEVIDIITRSRK